MTSEWNFSWKRALFSFKASFKSGTLAETPDLQIDTDTCIKELDQEGTHKYHKYHGVSEGDGIQHFPIKEKARWEKNTVAE